MEKAITRHYLKPGDEQQAVYLAKWMEARKSEEQLGLISQTESRESIEIAILLRRMALVGIPVTISVVFAVIILLVHVLGLWTLAALASAACLGLFGRKIRGL